MEGGVVSETRFMALAVDGTWFRKLVRDGCQGRGVVLETTFMFFRCEVVCVTTPINMIMIIP